MFEPDVGQLVFQLVWLGSFDHFFGFCESHFEYMQGHCTGLVDKKKKAVVGQDLMVEIDTIFGAVNVVKFVFFFSIDS